MSKPKDDTNRSFQANAGQRPSKQLSRSAAHLQKILQMQYFQIAARVGAVPNEQRPVFADTAAAAEPSSKGSLGLKLAFLCIGGGAAFGLYSLKQEREQLELASKAAMEAERSQSLAREAQEKEERDKIEAARRLEAEQRKTEQEFRSRLAQSVTLTRAQELAWFEEKFVRIEGGTFEMGSRMEVNNAVHPVHVSDFWMDSTEVTFAEWSAVVQWSGEFGYVFGSKGSAKKDSHPVAEVTWYDAVRWCNAKSERAGFRPCYYVGAGRGVMDVYRVGNLDLTNAMVDWTADGYRLPTEAEWEKAARGGLVGKTYPNGNKLPSNEANHSFNNLTPKPVKSYPPNGFGLYEMAGNLWEWVWDLYTADLSTFNADPRGPDSGERRLIRGGCFSGSPDSCGVATRVGFRGDVFVETGGFRIARRLSE
jgi:formylglycine-generating enzyme required for sulfatase activity